MLLDFSMSYENNVPQDDISRTIIDLTERMNLNEYGDFSGRDSHGYDSLSMLRACLLAFAERGYASVRELEHMAVVDVRFNHIFQGAHPSFQSFARFIQSLYKPVEDIFHDMNRLMEEDLSRIPTRRIVTEILTIDGSKWEANANKYTFVWKKATQRYYMKLWKKINKMLESLNRYFKREGIGFRYSILRQPDISYMIEILMRLEEYMGHKGIKMVHGKGCRKHELQKIYEEMRNCTVRLAKYTYYFDVLGDRNSFSKTDNDATFMHMKYDYYNHTNVFKPGYNVQYGISSGFIRTVYVSADPNDQPTLIPMLEAYHDAYGEYPSSIVADAGYGSFDNYKFCRSNDITAYVKYGGMHAESKKTNDKNRYQKAHMRQEDGSYRCPQGHEFVKISERIDKRGQYDKVMETWECTGCSGCPVKSECTRSKGSRKLSRTPELEEMQADVRERLDTSVGNELMNYRRSISEGTFGNVKRNYEYDRIRRRGKNAVKAEFYLVAMGVNLRKYHQILMEEKRRKNIN